MTSRATRLAASSSATLSAISASLVLAAFVCLAAGDARAQEEARPTPDGCAGRAALYAGGPKGTRIWVVRRGSMVLAENPLRPISRDRAVVLQVVFNGRLATAFGPDHENLRQGGAPADIERLGAEPIRWSDDAATPPPTLRVVADDGTVLLGPLPFVECADPPSAKPVAARRPEKPVAPERRPAGAAGHAFPQGPSIPGLPQGAIQSLDLPAPTSR